MLAVILGLIVVAVVTFFALPVAVIAVAGLFGLAIGYWQAVAIIIVVEFIAGLLKGKGGNSK